MVWCMKPSSMGLYELYNTLGSHPTLTFGVEPPQEIVGPLNPKSVQYGISNTDDLLQSKSRPIVHCNFNKYRSDLPPWNTLSEVVIASTVDGGVLEVVISESEVSTTKITGDLKSVSIVGESMDVGLDNASVVERERVYDDSGTGYTVGDD